jgi:uncharacterized protein (DUF924 family)
MATTAPDAQAVLDFWFGAEGSPEHGQLRAEWFRKDDAFDAQIAQRFGAPIEAALAGGLTDWDTTPGGALARIVLLDQFTRNTLRHTPRAFAGDALALAAAQAMLARGQDQALPPLQRVFMALPFEHSEDLAMQAQSVQLFTALAAADPALAGYLDYAHRHHAVVARFGRFPHRNEVLGRVSTAEELAFLQEPGSRF